MCLQKLVSIVWRQIGDHIGTRKGIAMVAEDADLLRMKSSSVGPFSFSNLLFLLFYCYYFLFVDLRMVCIG